MDISGIKPISVAATDTQIAVVSDSGELYYAKKA